MEIIEHEGVIKEVRQDSVVVVITQQAACVSCQVKSSCSVSESKEKEIEVVREKGCQYEVGTIVTLQGNRKIGLLAVWLAFVVPMLLIVATLLLTAFAGLNEALGAVSVLIITAVYYLLLHSKRESMKTKFSFTIK